MSAIRADKSSTDATRGVRIRFDKCSSRRQYTHKTDVALHLNSRLATGAEKASIPLRRHRLCGRRHCVNSTDIHVHLRAIEKRDCSTRYKIQSERNPFGSACKA